MRKFILLLVALFRVALTYAGDDDNHYARYYDTNGGWPFVSNYYYLGNAAVSTYTHVNTDNDVAVDYRYLDYYSGWKLNEIPANGSIKGFRQGSYAYSAMEVYAKSGSWIPIVLWTPTGNVCWEKSIDNGLNWTYIENTQPYYYDNDTQQGTALYRTLDPNGTFSEIVTVHYFDEIPQTIVTTPISVTKNVEESITFTLSIEDNDYSYQWMFNGGDIEGATGHDYTIPSIKAENAGIYTCKISNPLYEVISARSTLRVERIPQIIDFPIIDERTYGDPDFLLPELTDKGLPIYYNSSNHSVATINGNKVHIIAPGNTVITANQSGSKDYLPAEEVSQIFIVNKVPQKIDFGNIDVKSYGDAPFELPLTTDAGLKIFYSCDNSEIATINGNIVTIKNAGQTEITAVQNGDVLRAAALPVKQVLFVDKAHQTISFQDIEHLSYGMGPVKLKALSSSHSDIFYESSNNDIVSIYEDQLIITGAGTCDVIAKTRENSNYYNAEPVAQEVSVDKAILTIIVEDSTISTYDELPIFSLIFKEFCYDDTPQSLFELPTIEVPGYDGSEGEYPILLYGGFDYNYEYDLVPGKLTVINDTESVESINASNNFRVDSFYGILYISGVEKNKTLRVVNSSGLVVFSQKCDGEVIEITDLFSGVYIVTDGVNVKKICI